MPENPLLTINRTIYDPAIKDFVFDSGDGKALPNIKEWINSHNPVIYWYILRIDNPTEIDIFQWAIELYAHQALTIVEAYIDGSDRRFPLKKREKDAWSEKYVLSIPKEMGIPIMGKGTKRLYFKIDINCKEGLMHEYGISGMFKAHGMKDVEVKEKTFQYSCKVGEFRQIFDSNPDEASVYAERRLKGKYSSNSIHIFTNSFRMIHELSRYCHSGSVRQEGLISKLQTLHTSFEKVPEITGEHIIPLIKYEMDQLNSVKGRNEESLTPGLLILCDKLVEYLHMEVMGDEVKNAHVHSVQTDDITRKESVNAGQKECSVCGNLITESNKSLICMKCRSRFCLTCEEWFRVERKRGEKPLCEKCFGVEQNTKQEEEEVRIQREKEKKAKEEQERLRKEEEKRAQREKEEQERLRTEQKEKEKLQKEREEQKERERKQREEQLVRREEEKKEKEKQEHLKREQEERVKKLKEDQQKKQREKEEKDKQRIEEEQKEKFRLEQLKKDYDKGMNAFESGDWETAIAAFEQVVNIDHSYRDAAERLSLAATEKQKEEAVIKERGRQQKAKQEEERLRKHQEEGRKNKEIPKTYINSIGIEFTFIPAGEFMMGSQSSEKGGRDSERPVHSVNIANDFYIGKYVVTQKQWRDIMGKTPDYSQYFSYSKGENMPVSPVSWMEVQEFIEKLNEKESTDKYRLPSEAEWEYAARADTTSTYSFGDHELDLDVYAWYEANSEKKLQNVGQKEPNPWGLFDMHGNVWEWVQDNWNGNYKDAPIDGRTWESNNSTRVIRGGSWSSFSEDCRSSRRTYARPDYAGYQTATGFRLVREI